MVKRTERGWAGHFCASKYCAFRRNTLLEYEDIKVVVSTVGNYYHSDKRQGIGFGRLHETMCFHAKFCGGKYWDADVSREIYFDSNWSLNNPDDDDNIINDMHETVVNEITEKISLGQIKNCTIEGEND